MDKPKYPDIEFWMPEIDEPAGNAFWILARVTALMEGVGISKEVRDEFDAEATSGDYENLKDVIRKWITVHE